MPAISAALWRQAAALIPHRLTFTERNIRPVGFVAAHLDGVWEYVYFVHPDAGDWRGQDDTRARLCAALREESAAAPLDRLLSAIEAQP